MTMSKMITFHVPGDKELLAAFGEVALVHEHLNHILRMTIKTLAGLTPQVCNAINVALNL